MQEKICAICGRVYIAGHGLSMYCSKECKYEAHNRRKRKGNLDACLPLPTKEIQNRLPEQYEYVSGYVNCNSIITIRCRICGAEKTISADRIRPSRTNKEIRCVSCVHIERNRLKEEAANNARQKSEKIHKRKLEEKRAKTRVVTCQTCGITFTTTHSSKCTCSAECKKKRMGKMANLYKEVKRRNIGIVDPGITLRALIERDNNVCYICGNACDANDFVVRDNGAMIFGNNYPSIDHVYPVSKGGNHTWDNVRLAHRICNTLKGDKVETKHALQ